MGLTLLIHLLARIGQERVGPSEFEHMYNVKSYNNYQLLKSLHCLIVQTDR